MNETYETTDITLAAAFLSEGARLEGAESKNGTIVTFRFAQPGLCATIAGEYQRGELLVKVSDYAAAYKSLHPIIRRALGRR